MVRSALPFVVATLFVATPPLHAQEVDAGRGAVPVTIPASYDAGSPAPLILLLHGYGADRSWQDAYFGLSDLADDYGFLFVAPEGTVEDSADQLRFWNASDACCNLYGSAVDDVGYLVALLDSVSARWSVDPHRVYLVGHSNGGFMSYRMAYEHPHRIAAIASLAGAAQGGQRPPPAGPVNILQIHGTADEVIEYGGGAHSEVRYPGARASVGQWVQWNGCARNGRGREARDLDASLPGHETGALVYIAECAPGGRVTLWTILGGAHSPVLSETFAAQVVEWLYMHPKPGG